MNRQAVFSENTGHLDIWCVILSFMIFLVTLRPSAASALESSSHKVRESVLAGSWYPASASELRRQVEKFLQRVPESNEKGKLFALIVPHAGYVYSGPVAAYSYKLLEKRKFDTVIIIAPSHRVRFEGVSVYDQGGFSTPLGLVPIDRDLIEALEENDRHIRFVAEAHAMEHAVEIQLPFLQVLMPAFKLVPLVMGSQDLETCRRLARSIADCSRGRSVLVVASSDLSHFHTDEEARRLDRRVEARIGECDVEGLSQDLAEGKSEACGGGPIVAAMLAAKLMGANRCRILHYGTSGDVTGDRNRVVGYLAAALLAEESSDADKRNESGSGGVKSRLGPEERKLLHRLAKESIEAKFRGENPPDLSNVPTSLNEKRGAFVTLKIHGRLRGCIGSLVADRPLVEVVREMAVAAAFQDPRFRPVSAAEVPELEIEISVLSPFEKITDVNEIQVGVHGILMRRGSSSGLLLPQVATEYGWDRTSFLEHTCLKAGLPSNAWKDKETEIYVFSAEVF